MKIKLITVGKTQGDWLIKAIAEYTSRLVHYTTYECIEIPDVKFRAQIDFDNTKTYIGDLLSFRNEGSSKTLISAYYSSQQLHVSLPSEAVEDCTVINIYNTIGRLMNSFSNHETQNLVLDVSNLPTGVYFLNIPGQPILRFFKDN